MKNWVLAARPKTLLIGMAPVLLGGAIAFQLGSFDFPLYLCTLFCALTIQMGANLTNDFFDAKQGVDTNKRVGPTRAVASGLIQKTAMAKGIFLTFGFAAVLGSYLIFQGGAIFAFLLALSIAFAIFYTAGSHSLARIGLGDLVTLLFFGPIAVGGTIFLQTKALYFPGIWLGFVPGLYSAAILNRNNIRDLEGDCEAGRKTIPVRFGRNVALQLFSISILVALILPIPYAMMTRKPLLMLPSAIFLIPTIQLLQVQDDRIAFAKTPPLEFSFCLLLALCHFL
ncbi:MAG: 1,4-dihydroxy-2-naphthoate octaprenyltransferase [Candidatus Algichlamydia australiensis]|nr:1,4-dihydroxy-2-naphthoate octaprenyltransferase [Chlamydiales bacterium]